MNRIQMMSDGLAVRISLLIAVGLVALGGCADGLWYQMKKANPYYRAEWKRDEEYGTTFLQRLSELKLLRDRLPSMDPSEQLAWAGRLEQVIAKDPSPEFRTQAVAAIAMIPGEATIRALNVASADSTEKVRLAACNAWQQIGGPEARDMLMTLANKSSESTSIRQSAIEGLAQFNEAEVRETLALLLEDRSPAIQYQVTRSLAKLSGKDFGGDMQAWRDYLSGQDVPEPPKSLTAKVLESAPFLR